MGRFMTADWAAKPTAVPYANYGNPQSLNLYSYVENNPTTAADLDGHGQCTGGGSGIAEGQGLGPTCDAVQKQKTETNAEKSQEQKDEQTYHRMLDQKKQQFLDSQAAPPVGSPEYIARVSSKVTAEMHAGNKVIALVALVEGFGFTAGEGGPQAAAGMRAAVVLVATHPEEATDLAKGLAAGRTKLPPMSPAGMAGWVAGNIIRSIIP